MPEARRCRERCSAWPSRRSSGRARRARSRASARRRRPARGRASGDSPAAARRASRAGSPAADLVRRHGLDRTDRISVVTARRELQPASRTEWAEARLRSTIVSGELAPGARVRVEELAAKWEVSSTPLREAIRSLAGEGLITLSPQRGARVSEVSRGEMEDVYATRLMLEPYVLRLSLERAGDEWLAELERAWNELDARSRSIRRRRSTSSRHTRRFITHCSRRATRPRCSASRHSSPPSRFASGS